MKLYLTAALLLMTCLVAQAQQLMPAETTTQKNISIQQPQPLVLVGAEETATDALILKPDRIESIDVYKGQEAIGRYGGKAKDGAIIMALKAGTPLVRLPQVYAAFNVPPRQQQLQVAVNDKRVNAKLLLADLKEIDRVEVKTQDVTSPVRYSFDEDEPYLNIVTK